MDANDLELINEVIAILKRRGYIGFIGSFVKASDMSAKTMHVSAPGFDEKPFKEAERRVADIMNEVFGGKDCGHEDGYLIDPDFLHQ